MLLAAHWHCYGQDTAVWSSDWNLRTLVVRKCLRQTHVSDIRRCHRWHGKSVSAVFQAVMCIPVFANVWPTVAQPMMFQLATTRLRQKDKAFSTRPAKPLHGVLLVKCGQNSHVVFHNVIRIVPPPPRRVANQPFITKTISFFTAPVFLLNEWTS